MRHGFTSSLSRVSLAALVALAATTCGVLSSSAAAGELVSAPFYPPAVAGYTVVQRPVYNAPVAGYQANYGYRTNYGVVVQRPVVGYRPPVAVMPAPVVTYYAPPMAVATPTPYYVARPVVAAPMYVGQSIYLSPKVYVQGQPIRNLIRAVTP